MVAATRRATIADLDAMPDDGRRYELIDGEIFVAAAPSWQHEFTSRAVFRLLDGWVQQHVLGETMFAPFDILLNDETIVEPDIFVLTKANLPNLQSGRYHGAPDLTIEVVSPSNRDYDTVTKMFRYAQSGVREYWLVDPAIRTVQILSLVDGIYVPQKANDRGHYASVVLPGLVVDPETIFTPVGATT